MNKISVAVALLATAGLQPVLADDAKTAAPAKPEAPSPAAFAASTPLPAAELGEQRAKAKIEIDKLTLNVPEQNGIVAGNTAINTHTGGNSIAGDAFAGAAGFIGTIQNTGNNVLIQNSTIVNVSVAP